MTDINYDIYATKAVSNGRKIDGYGKIYFHANDYLKKIFEDVCVNRCKVLTVTGSGDQAFYLYNAGCESLDLIDINKLTMYYFYLRKWVIQYLNQFYPDEKINRFFLNNLLSKVVPKSNDEYISLEYWKLFLKNIDNINIENLFNFGMNTYINKIDDISLLRDKMGSINPRFYNKDLFEDIEGMDSDYNTIYTSNIADYKKPTVENFRPYLDNLCNLMGEYGDNVICANVLRGKPRNVEAQIFKESFAAYRIPEIEDKYISGSPGTIYTRKIIFR